MALKPEVEKVLAKITDVKAREEATRLYEANPVLQEAVLAQEDYSRKIQEVTRKEKLADEKYQSNLKWFKDSSEQIATIEQERDRLSSERQALEVEIQGIRAGKPGGPPSGSVDQSAIEAATAGIAAKYDAKIANLEKDLASAKTGSMTQKQYEDDITNRGNNLGGFLMDVVEAKERHLREFGQPLLKEDLYKYMTDNKIGGVNDAYEKMTAETRQKSWEKQKEAEIEARILKDISAKQLPIGEGGSPLPHGPLQKWLNKETGIPEGINADGSGRLAAIAAQELRGEGRI